MSLDLQVKNLILIGIIHVQAAAHIGISQSQLTVGPPLGSAALVLQPGLAQPTTLTLRDLVEQTISQLFKIRAANPETNARVLASSDFTDAKGFAHSLWRTYCVS